jgi:uncharacterized protein YukE
MTMGGEFTYHPGALPEYVHQVVTSSAELEDIRSQAQTILNSVHDYFNGMGPDAFVHAQMLINQGIDEGQQIIRQHGDTVDQAHQGMIGQDMSAAQAFHF